MRCIMEKSDSLVKLCAGSRDYDSMNKYHAFIHACICPWCGRKAPEDLICWRQECNDLHMEQLRHYRFGSSLQHLSERDPLPYFMDHEVVDAEDI